MFPLIITVVLIINTNFFIGNISAYGEKPSERRELSRSGKEKIELAKCCPANKVVYNDINTISLSCVDYNGNVTEFTELTIYDKYIHNKPINASFFDLYRVTPELRPSDANFSELYIFAKIVFNTYLKKDGILYLEYPNAYKRWMPINQSSYCLDYSVDNNNTLSNNFDFYCTLDGEQPKSISVFFKAAVLISSVFLFLVLVVYLLLPGLRNLGGMILMAYVFSLMFAFIFLFTMQLQSLHPDVCVKLTTTTYFFFLASFCWMNVMSFDIWWTFRGYAKARAIHRRGETFKFLMYCLYGWGVPLGMSLFFYIINGTPLRHMPWFVKPLIPEMGCFIEGGQKLVYLYAPMLILIMCNWIFFLMTAFNIWRLNRNTSMLDSPSAGNPAAHRNQRTRFFIYLKLSIIMGINWVLEVVSSLTPDYEFWFLTDLYNLFIGLAIFLIFVCKKKTFRELKARGYAKARAIHRRGETFKFLMYCLYGWGVPLGMSLFFYIINGTPLRHMPWFVKPLIPEMGCFIEGGQKLVYLYAPMLILIMCNWIFFLMTAFNIWRLNRNTSMLDSPSAGNPAAHRNQRTRFFIYLKLSIIMGINWVLEVVSSLTPDYEFWFLTDLYNLFIGLAIFLIFVCKKKTFRELKARGYAKARAIHRRGETFKFLMYCLYGWGVPLGMSLFFYIINGTPLRHMPWFVKPLIPEMGCFIEGGQKLVYLYAPMLILIMCNWIFFLMTAFNIWRLNRNTSMLDSPSAGNPAAHRNQRTRFFIYLKLSIIMGINWVLEVVSSLTPDYEFWFLTDLYNLFIGLAIFLIFVCKKKTFRELKARLIRKPHSKPRRSLAKSQTSCTTLSNSSQDTPLKINYHPKGTTDE